MSHFLEGTCYLQKGSHPAVGKCILKGKVPRAKDINSERPRNHRIIA